MTGRRNALLGLGLVAVLTTGACTADAGPASTSSGAGSGMPIPQPTPPQGLPLAPESQRVDLARPTFSNPTTVTNPLFPVSAQASVLHLENADGEPLRTEVTTLPYTFVLDWAGERIDRYPRPTTGPSGTSASTCTGTPTAWCSTPTGPGSPGRTARQP